MIDDIRRWVYARHWRGWLGHVLLAGAISMVGSLVGQPEGGVWLGCGLYVIDTADDLLKDQRDPWWDHVMDTAAPCAAAIGVAMLLDTEDDKWTTSSLPCSVSSAVPCSRASASAIATSASGWTTWPVAAWESRPAGKRPSVALLFSPAQVDTMADVRW